MVTKSNKTEGKKLREITLGDESLNIPESMPVVEIAPRAKKNFKVAAYDLNGKFVKVFGSIPECAEELKISKHTIRRCINPKYEKVHVKQYQFIEIK